MRSKRTMIAALGLFVLALWALGGIAVTGEVLATTRAADVVAASALCPPACPEAPAPSWVAMGVMAVWVLLAVGSAVALAVLLGRRLLDSRDA